MDRRPLLLGLALLIIPLAFVSFARADMCAACSDEVYPLSFGKCEVCGQETLSVELRLCPECSAKLDQCEHCRKLLHPKAVTSQPASQPAKVIHKKVVRRTAAVSSAPIAASQPSSRPARARKNVAPSAAAKPVAAATTRPTTRPVEIAQAAATQPATEPVAAEPKPPVATEAADVAAEKAQERSPEKTPEKLSSALTPVSAQRREDLLAGLESFTLTLRYIGPQDDPYRSVILSVPQANYDVPAHASAVCITPQQAHDLVEHLAGRDWLARAIDASNIELPNPRGPGYTLTVHAGKLTLYQKLEWALPMVNVIDALAGVVDGDAGAALRGVLEPLDRTRREWEDVIPVNGMRMHVEPAKPAFAVGEPVVLNIAVENKCDDPLAFYTGSLLQFWSAEVVGVGARREFRLPPAPPASEDAFQTVEAEQTQTLTVPLSEIGPQRWQLTQPGTYKVNLIHDVQPEQLGDFRRRESRVIGKWIGQIVTNTATITIVP